RGTERTGHTRGIWRFSMSALRKAGGPNQATGGGLRFPAAGDFPPVSTPREGARARGGSSARLRSRRLARVFLGNARSALSRARSLEQSRGCAGVVLRLRRNA